MPDMPKKKPPHSPAEKHPKTPPHERIIDAALHLAEIQGWDMTTVRDIALEAGVELEEFYQHYTGREEIIAAYGRRLDRKMFKAFPEAGPETSTRDMLFDVLMERFDLANADKPALTSILSTCRTDPKLLLINLPQLGGTVTRILETAGISPYGIKGAFRIAGMTAALLYVMRVWLKDDTVDLSRTMVALDKALDRCENIAGRFNL